MSETANLIHAAAHRLFAQYVSTDVLNAAEKGVWAEALWDAVEDAGFLDTLADADTSPQERASNTAVLLRAAGRHLAPIPLGETIVARSILSAHKVKVPRGPITFAVLDGHTHTHGDHAHLKGRALRVAYARHSANVLLSAQDSGEAVLIAVRRGTLKEGANVAGEPRDELAFGDTAGTTVSGVSGDDLLAYGATVRSALIAGALERILMQTVEYARTRVQFGKPIASFQAIQQQLAVLAGHTAAAGIATDAAFADVEDSARRARSAAIAKVRAGDAAGAAASIAHQVHGAIGITKEHSLHFATRRLYSWRAEFGAESFWAEKLGRAACSAGADAFWPSVTQ